MLDFLSGLLFDLLPSRVQWGCLVGIILVIGGVLLWAHFA